MFYQRGISAPGVTSSGVQLSGDAVKICGQGLQVVSENGLSVFAELLRKSCVARIFSLTIISAIVAVEVISVASFVEKTVDTVAI